MAKKRVHEVAKELGYTSKEVLAKLQEIGEFVKAASSTIEPPTEKRLRAALPAKNKPEKEEAAKPAASEQKAKAKPPKPGVNKTVAARKNTKKTIEDINLDELDPQLRAEAERLKARRDSESGVSNGPVKRPAPRPPATRHAGGNNPFSTTASAPVEGERTPGVSRRKVTAKPGAVRSNAVKPGGRSPFSSGNGPTGGGRGRRDGNGGVAQGGGTRQKPGQRSGSTQGAPGGRGGGPGAAPGRGQGPVGGGFGKGSRGRGGTQGAFGRGGSSKKQRKSKRAKRQELEQLEAPVIGGVTIVKGDGETVVRMRRGATINDFAEKINADPAALITALFHLGEMATATQSLDEDTFALLGAELGYDVQIFSSEDEDRELLEQFDINLEAELEAEGDDVLQPRPPVVTVMGHVDHGKTRLLDAIRNTNVIDDEHGGITQRIGAYQIHYKREDADRPITFIDTPGHEAFTAMRARGAKVTDIAILVVAADDGVMPQTVEALNHAQAAEVPLVVAINKIDKEGANPEKTMGQLTEYGLVPEEYGGDTMFVNVSAREGQHIDDLLEAVLLTADAALDLRANPNKEARGVAIEAHLDKGRGAIATVLVQSGTLRVGDSVVVGSAYGRVRAMLDDEGHAVDEATPSEPVQMLGLSAVPRAGDSFLATGEERSARQIAEKREAAERNALLAKRRKRINLEALNDAIAQGKIDTLSLILKGDASGAVEALEDALLQIEVGEGVGLRVIHRGVGAVTQNDVNLATVDNAVIIGFNVRPAERVAELADKEGVDMRFYNVIYSAIDDIEASLKGMLKPEFEEQQQGSAEVREIFRSSKFGNIAGCMIQSGVIRRNGSARVVREGVVVGENVVIETLRRFKDDTVEVREGYECGIGLGSFNDIQVGDVVETFEMVEIPRA